jgi:hypothetical protein
MFDTDTPARYSRSCVKKLFTSHETQSLVAEFTRIILWPLFPRRIIGIHIPYAFLLQDVISIF